jgi:hypothetical protein
MQKIEMFCSCWEPNAENRKVLFLLGVKCRKYKCSAPVGIQMQKIEMFCTCWEPNAENRNVLLLLEVKHRK